MADKKGNCGCGCIGQKQGSPKVTPKATNDKKKGKKSKECMENLAVKKEAGELADNPCPLSKILILNRRMQVYEVSA